MTEPPLLGKDFYTWIESTTSDIHETSPLSRRERIDFDKVQSIHCKLQPKSILTTMIIGYAAILRQQEKFYSMLTISSSRASRKVFSPKLASRMAFRV